MDEQDRINDAVWREGWGIFDCDGSDNGPFQICRIDSVDDDDVPQLEDDSAAWRIVLNRAAEGSAIHRAALQFVKDNNRIEYDAIAKFAGRDPLELPHG